MSDIDEKQQGVEKRFQELRNQTTLENWSSTSYLITLAEKLEETDAPLAKQISVRIESLNKLPQKSSPINLPTTKQEIKAKFEKIPHVAKIEHKQIIKKIAKSGLFLLVLLPSLIFALYQFGFAAKRYESRSQLIVQQPDGMATMDTSLALLSGFGLAANTTSDAQLVKTYIHSNDMLDFLDKELSIAKHYTTENTDIFSGLSASHTQEALLKFYQKMVKVEIKDESAIIQVSAQAYTPDYAQRLTQSIVKRAEWYINQIGNSLAEHQLDFVRGEHIKVEEKLSNAKNTLLDFQEKYNLLDPEAEGLALQQIAYGLEAKIAEKQSELSALTAIMSANAPQVKAARNELRALQNQLSKERARLSSNRLNSNNNGAEKALSVGAILAKYAELKINLELALKAFTSSEISLEKARMETYRKLKYLVVVESPTLPEDNRYPKALYNITLFVLLAAMLYGIGRLILATVREIK